MPRQEFLTWAATHFVLWYQKEVDVRYLGNAPRRLVQRLRPVCGAGKPTFAVAGGLLSPLEPRRER